jgi:hypothetical protein
MNDYTYLHSKISHKQDFHSTIPGKGISKSPSPSPSPIDESQKFPRVRSLKEETPLQSSISSIPTP